MTVPGSNLLKQALTVIQPQTIVYYKANGRAVNTVGQYQTSYDTGVSVLGSFQPIPRQLYQQYGLDLQKDYYTFYTLNDIIDIARDVSNDQIAFNGNRYQCESNTEWFQMDGWKGVVCCYISPDGGN